MMDANPIDSALCESLFLHHPCFSNVAIDARLVPDVSVPVFLVRVFLFDFLFF